MVLVLTILGIVLTLSRGVIISILLSTIVLFYIYKPTKKSLLLLFVLLLLSLSIVYYFTQYIDSLGLSLKDDRGDVRNINDRLSKFGYAVKILDTRPFTGYGAGRYISYDIDSVESAIHNTYLENIISYGYVLGTIAILCLFRMAIYYYKFEGSEKCNIMSKHIFIGILAYLIICTNQTTNEAFMPNLLFKIFLGISSAILCSKDTDIIYQDN
jgi:O-antigen ligase